MFLLKSIFAICYISVNVMAIVTVFRFEDVSRAMTISAFGSSGSSTSGSSSVVEALALQVDHSRASRQHQQRQQRPNLSLSMKTAEERFFQVSQSQGTDIFNNNNSNNHDDAQNTFHDIDVEDLQQQHEQMQKMMMMMQPQEEKQEEEQQQEQLNVISIPSLATTTEAIGKSSVSSTQKRTSSGRMTTILKGICLSSANDLHQVKQPKKKKDIIKGIRLSSAMANGDKKLGPISYKMVVQDLQKQDVQMKNRMTIQGIYLSSSLSSFDEQQQVGPASPCWKQKNLVVSI